MIFELVQDFAAAVAALPEGHPRRRMLRLLGEAIRRDIHFLARHPAALFQCLWNTCWWYDCEEAARHFVEPAGGWPTGSAAPPWRRPPREKLSELLEFWRWVKEENTPGFPWLRALRPPPTPLGTAQQAVLIGHEKDVNSVAFTPDQQRIISGSQDRTIRIWDTQTGRELQCLRGFEGPVDGVAVSPDGRTIASGEGWTADNGSLNCAVRLWDTETGRQSHCLRGHTNTVDSVAFSPDGRRLASGSSDTTVRIWDGQTGQPLAALGPHERGVGCVAWSPDSRWIASVGGAALSLWDAGDGRRLYARKTPDSVHSVAFSPDGRLLVLAYDYRVVAIWDAQAGEELRRLRGHADYVLSAVFSPDGRRIASGSYDQTVRIWDTATWQEVRCLTGHEGPVRCVAYSPDGRRIVSAGGFQDHTVRVWDADSLDEPMPLCGREDSQGRGVNHMAFSPGGEVLVCGDSDMLRFWSLSSGLMAAGLEAPGSTSVVFSSDGRRIAGGSTDQVVRVWDAQSHDLLHCLGTPEGAVVRVGFARQDRHVVAGIEHREGEETHNGLINVIRVWDADSGKELEARPGTAEAFATLCPPDPMTTGAHLLSLLRHGHETKVQVSGLGQVLWLPLAFNLCAQHSASRRFAAAINDHVFLFAVEGDAEDRP